MEAVCRGMVKGIGLCLMKRSLNYSVSRIGAALNTNFLYLNQNCHYCAPQKTVGHLGTVGAKVSKCDRPPFHGITTRSLHTQHSDSSGSGESLVEILEREIKDETAELRNRSEQIFPGFDVQTDGAEVRLSKKYGQEGVSVIFNVSSSLHEWVSPTDKGSKQDDEQQEEVRSDLVSMPDFQVQVTKDNKTLEFSCYFVEAEPDEETGEVYSSTAEFDVHELVMYEGEPKASEFAVSTEYFNEELQESLLSYLSRRGVNEEFGRNLVNFATTYEKEQYIGMMEKLKTFVE